MKVYYSASIARTQKLRPVSQDIVKMIEELGHEVLTKELVDPKWTDDPHWQEKLNGDEIYQQAEKRIEDADVLITECTVPSFGAGWWIDKAVTLKKPLLSLHYGEFLRDVPVMLRGRRKEINLQMYTEENIKHVLELFFNTI